MPLEELHSRPQHIQDIIKKYPAFEKETNEGVVYSYKNVLAEQIIYEFNGRTVNYDKTIKTLEKRYNGKYIKAEIIYNETRISITFEPNQNNIYDVNKFMRTFGWYPEVIKDVGPFKDWTLSKLIESGKEITLFYGANYDTEIKVDGYLYHLFPDIFNPHIKRKGLTPKNKAKLADHPERIYLLNPTDRNGFEDVAYSLWEKILPIEVRNSIKDYYLLKIDTSKLSPKHKFFIDPRFHLANGGVWTYEPIPPNAIEIVDLILVNSDAYPTLGLKIAGERRDKLREEFLGNIK